jgi:hypothetical protein
MGDLAKMGHVDHKVDQDQEENRVQWDLLVCQVHQESLDFVAPVDLLENQEKMVEMVLMEILVQMGHLVPQDPKGKQELMVLMVFLGVMETLVFLAQGETKETKELLVKLVKKVPKELMDQLDHLVPVVIEDPLEMQVQMENLVLQVKRDQRGSQVQLDQMVTKETLVTEEQREIMDSWASKERRAHEAPKDRGAYKDTSVNRVTLDPKENLDLVAQMVLLEYLDLWDFLGQKDQLETMGPRVILEKMVDKGLQDHLDHQVLPVLPCYPHGWEGAWQMVNQKVHQRKVKKKAQKRRRHQRLIHFSRFIDITQVTKQRSLLKLS